MHDLKKLFLFLAVISLFSSGIVSTAPAFADDDDDEKKKDKNKDKITKLQKECAKEPKKPYKIKPECELLNLINDSAPDPRADSFFDVFFDVESYSVDSFFDIFTELQTSSSANAGAVETIPLENNEITAKNKNNFFKSCMAFYDEFHTIDKDDYMSSINITKPSKGITKLVQHSNNSK